jgi:peroxiredoxin Q/BCP
MLDVGSPFPNFSLQNQSGDTVTLADLKGSKTIVYFYPKDDTPGCTVEACAFRDNLPKFTGAKVFGVSPDSFRSHKKFAEKFGLNFPLLADEKHALAEACSTWVEKSMMGRNYMGVERTTFLLDADAMIEKVWRKVKPEGHADEVLAALAG